MKKQSLIMVAVIFSLLYGATTNAEDLRLAISRDGVISWPKEDGVIYRVFSSTNLQEWEEISTMEMNAINAFETTMTNGAHFFRVQKYLPPVAPEDRKSKPTFAMLDAGTDPINEPLYRFSVVADATGNIEIKKLSFRVQTLGCLVHNLYLYDPNTSMVLSKILPEPYGTTDISLNPSGIVVELPIGLVADDRPYTDDQVITVGTAPRVLELRATVTDYSAAGDSITVGFAKDTVLPPDEPAYWAICGSYNVWSDRSALTHSVNTFDWTNGYLLEGMDGIQVFTK